MATVIGVRFKNAGKLYYFSPGTLWPTAGDGVIVETARGVEYGEVVTGVSEIDDSALLSPLKPVLRIADARDAEHLKENSVKEREAFVLCQQKIQEHKLEMKLVGVEYTFDNAKILFYFTANGRVDFRALVKDLASLFKTRIELRQIGVRDEAKMMGGLGACGRTICCASFLGDFQPVSIKMAKEQNLSLNPTKISGICGRLMCCLKYEQDTYEQVRKTMPRVGKEVMTPDGPGFVIDVNIVKETVRVRVSRGDSGDLKDYPATDVTPLAGGKPIAETSAKNGKASAPGAETEPDAELHAPDDDIDDQKSDSGTDVPEADAPKSQPKPRPKPQPKPVPEPAHKDDAKPAPEQPSARAWPTAEAIAARLAESALHHAQSSDAAQGEDDSNE